VDRIFASLVALLLTIILNAHAQAEVTLKEGEGRELVEQICGGRCHKADERHLTSPNPSRKGWEAEVNKMIKIFGARISAADGKIIVDYLTKNYGAGD